MAPDTQPIICLGVAVDHRIRRLFKPVSNDLAEHSDHVFRIKARGLSLERPQSEIQVTTQLAGPAVKGGIAVALQQPRHNHPFEEGLNAVIEDCETLSALDDVFSAVSCGYLSIRANIAVVDLLPYIHDKIESIDDATLEESFRASKHIMLDKEPSVLLCAGRIWLSDTAKHYKLKGDAHRLESLGVGQKFGLKYPVTTRIRREEGRGFVTIKRVNGFHPSHAMNHHLHVSCLRQLQILIGAETCGMLRGDWEEKDWMDGLRRRCQNVSGALSESPNEFPRPQSPGESSTRRNNTTYLPYYQELYSKKLIEIHTCVQSLISEQRLAMKSSTVPYKSLLSSCLSEFCNDATLILREMARLERNGWPNFVARRSNAAVKEATSDTVRFTKDLLKTTEPGKDTQFAEIIQEGANVLLECVSSGSRRRLEPELDFDKAGDAFLEMATSIETLLMDLLLEEEEVLHALEHEESLSSKMEKMTLTSSVIGAASPLSPASHV